MNLEFCTQLQRNTALSGPHDQLDLAPLKCKEKHHTVVIQPTCACPNIYLRVQRELAREDGVWGIQIVSLFLIGVHGLER
jgi:hypothetical protein